MEKEREEAAEGKKEEAKGTSFASLIHQTLLKSIACKLHPVI
jgi:hypothetical protein